MSTGMATCALPLLQPSPYVISPSPHLHLISTCTSTSPPFPHHLPHHLYNTVISISTSTSSPPHLTFTSFLIPVAQCCVRDNRQLAFNSRSLGSAKAVSINPRRSPGCLCSGLKGGSHLAFWALSASAAGIQPFEGPGRTVLTFCQDFCEVVFLGCFVLFS